MQYIVLEAIFVFHANAMHAPHTSTMYSYCICKTTVITMLRPCLLIMCLLFIFPPRYTMTLLRTKTDVLYCTCTQRTVRLQSPTQ